MYYVYEWFNTETNEIFYVGKGIHNRYKVKKRNKCFNEYIKNHKCDSRIIKWFDNEADAFKYEFEYINQQKENGMCFCNLHTGGARGSGEYWTEELRKEYSIHNVMKSEMQRKRMSANNPMKNKEICERVNGQKRKPVIIGDTEYASVKEAVEALNVSSETIAYWCKRGANRKGEACRYKNSQQVIYDGKRFNKGGCKAIIYKDKEYESPIDIAKKLNIGVGVVYRWAKNGFDPYGNPCRYVGDNRQLHFERKVGQKHHIIVNEKHYQSISEASRQLGIDQSYIRNILKGKINSKKYICKYDNQQPSTNLNG